MRVPSVVEDRVMETLRVTNPATGQLIQELPAADTAAVDAAIARAREAQPAWGALPFSERKRILRRVARALRDDATFLDILCAESGKPRYEAENIELFYTLELTRYYTGRAGWPLLNNYGDCIAPLAAGNAVVLKPSEHTPMTSLRTAALARDAGLPEGVFQVVAGRGDAGAALTASADMIFFTGSAATGQRVAQTAAARLIPFVLELGGKSPMIVLADADLPRAAHAAVWSGFAHSGQVCIRTERVIVESSVADRFVELAAAEVARLRQGPPAPGRPDATDVDVGAITFAPQIERAEQQIADAVARGARVVTGGARRTDLPGQFFAPTLLADVTPDMAVMREETFGPVLPVMRVADAEAALRAANDTPMGLSGSVWSGDAERALALARRLQAGSVCVNDALMNYFCVEAPLGGVKGSGVGFRHGPEALRQFCRVETIVEDHPLLGWLSPLLARELTFPYNRRTQRLLRWFMRAFY